MKEIKRTVKEAYLMRNALGWIHLVFKFEEGDSWSIPHLNEGLNFMILDYFLGCGDDLSIFVGKTVTLKCKYPECLQSGIISFDTIDQWKNEIRHVEVNVDEKLSELSEKYEKMYRAVETVKTLPKPFKKTQK